MRIGDAAAAAIASIQYQRPLPSCLAHRPTTGKTRQ